MHACTVTAAKGAADATVLVVGHYGKKVPAAIEDEAVRIAKGDARAPAAARVDGRDWVLVKPEPKDWLVGGEEWRLVGKAAIDALRARGRTRAEVLVEADDDAVAALCEGVLLADYRFDECRSGEDAKRGKVTIRIPGRRAAVARGVLVAGNQNHARTLADSPGNRLGPASFVRKVRALFKGTGVRVRVVQGLAELQRANFPGLVQVGRAGAEPPALVELTYRPTKAKKSAPKLALVGKGITFDSGGISLKPGPDMWQMKGDMGGAAAVTGGMLAIAAAKPKVPVTGYLALAENMPDAKAQRPGDVYKARNGTWIHVDNTDAEGRLVLSDVLTYACERGATHLVDAATLTGACLVALGPQIGGLMSNDRGWGDRVRTAGQEVGEELWPLPLYGAYDEMLKHPHADVNNIGGRFAGTITAGLFLQRFVDPDVKWTHLDIAGPAMMGGEWRCFVKGNTGFGTRTFLRLAESLA